MDFNGVASRPRSLVPDSPAIKRQKTSSGYNSTSTSTGNTGVFNSDEEDGDEVIPDTPGHGYLTQPTQILPRNTTPLLSSPSTPLNDVQVPLSSPMSRNSSAVPVTIHSHPPRPSSLAGGMAPRGTIFRPPAGVVNDDPKYEVISSDDEDTNDRDIQPTKFESAKSSFNGSAPARAPSEGKGSSEFHSILERSKFVGNGKPNILSNGSGVVKRSQTQTLPSRAQPVSPAMDDRLIQKQIQQIRLVLKDCSEKRAYDALIASNLNTDDALERLLSNRDVIVIHDNDNSAPEPAQMKHGLQGRVKSIAEKYSSFPASQMHSSPTALPAKPKKRLVQGRKNASSPAAPRFSSPPKAEEIEAYDSYDSDSAVGSENEEDHTEIEAEVLKYINNCSAKDLVDTTAFPAADIEFLIASRPFKTLDAARLVDRAKTTKTGKKSNRISVGEKIVDKCVAMFVSFDAVKKLQNECAELGKPVGEEMAKWGFDVLGASRNGELEVVSFEETSQMDSGLGTPNSGVTSPDGDDEVLGPVAKRTRKPNFLKQPETMKIDQDEHPGEVFEMKDYQIVGLNWLALMYRLKLSCILADDMGLGKTCQVISFLTHLVETGRTGPHIIVCPGSTLDNWCEEMSRISPKINFLPYHDSKDKRGELQLAIKDSTQAAVEESERVHVIITTYDMARPKDDGKFLRQLHADVVVYDEGHVLKNPDSQRYQNLIKIEAKFRLLLTGTPLQNNLRELVAILAFILPDVFKGLTEDLEFIFKAKATTSDSDHAQLLSKQRIDRARSILTPFVLRRKKEQVLKHLPAKTRRVVYTEMPEDQNEIYTGLKKIFKKETEDTKDAKAIKATRATKASKAVNASENNNPLMQLRKAAIHPLLFRRHFDEAKIKTMANLLRRNYPEEFKPSEKLDYLIQEMSAMSDFVLHTWCKIYPAIKKFDIRDLSWLDSGKVDALVDLLKSYAKNGDKALVFSQFAGVLDILEEVLNTIKIKFARIDGSTPVKERQPLINDFNNIEEITVFLLTTKAGGTGINLVSANKVIIFDSSFNPQDDRQAENRAHRYGQKRDVEVVILVSKNTIEEKILALGESKLELDERVAEAAIEEQVLGEEAVS